MRQGDALLVEDAAHNLCRPQSAGFITVTTTAVAAAAAAAPSMDVQSANGYREPSVGGQQNEGGQAGGMSSLPVLASACPGWVVYAEKTHGQYVLPYMSRVKSPQQVMGSVIKRFACQRLNLRVEDVYHVSVMPCYDKKLEAVRDEFLFAVPDTESDGAAAGRAAEVDCVLTSGELLDILLQQEGEDRGQSFADEKEAPMDTMLSNLDEKGMLYGARGGSGGYADAIFRYTAKKLFGHKFPDSDPLLFRDVRKNSADLKELTLEVEGRTVLKVALVYGFQHIQNLLRKIKSGRCDYHFVEVMACPGGCLNGGGQPRPRKGQPLKSHLQDLEAAYLKEVVVANPHVNPVAQGLYREWLQHPGSKAAMDALYTTYKQRERSVSSLISSW
eukprot:TRINITY_DN2481_c0_g3_i4.p1 TRINITY_DN2481_c0_g3~~TRINITY_DN2481_c0_g3_i4.p1  ORF type:complete len:387 (+),score=92.71 TRINITY_DN2481_c0_g3_i4:136-1296(+)